MECILFVHHTSDCRMCSCEQKYWLTVLFVSCFSFTTLKPIGRGAVTSNSPTHNPIHGKFIVHYVNVQSIEALDIPRY